MDRLLNRKIAFVIFFLLGILVGFAQQEIEEQYHDTKDYKDPQQFEKFRKKRKTIAAWQINKLKDGALVVKLKTNDLQIKAFKNIGEIAKAKEKTIETFIINKNIMMAYIDNFKFCKLYFIYSNSNDSLMNGVRKGIFLDTNLVVDPSIVMNEGYYLIAEKDFVYNSSIGFVKQDTAKFVTEHGNPSGGTYDIVIKNKYGHQLKHPFPYIGSFGKKFTGFVGPIPMFYKYEDGKIIYSIDKTQLADRKLNPAKSFKRAPAGYSTMFLRAWEVYEYMGSGTDQFNYDLEKFYKSSTKPDETKIDPEILPFLY
jgi:hypothetical protein